uniref:Erythrocyte membrane protein band 4.1-like 4A n=1 Tax=Cyanoderma ruficeps TaxID=181631 RepID=A0A8C3NVU6_9PASS
MMRRGAGAGQVPSAALRPKGAPGGPGPAAGRRRPALPGRWVSLFSIPPPRTGRRRALPEEAASRRPRTVTALLRPQGQRPEVTRWPGWDHPYAPAAAAESAPRAPLLHTKGRRNSAQTGRRARWVGGSVLPQGGSGGGAAVRAGRGRGLCPRILPKKAAGLFLSLPPGRTRQPRPGCSAGWRRSAAPGWALRLSSRRATSAQPGRGAGRSPDPAAPQPLSAAAWGSSRLPAPFPAIAAGMGCFCAVPEEFYCEVLLLDESKLTLTTQQQGIKKSTKGSVVLGYVFRHLNLVEIDYFGLRYCDRSHQTYWLDPAKTLAEHKELINTGPPYTLYFGIKFYAEDPCKLKEEITRYQFFLQVKQDVLQGRLPCPINTAAQLGAYIIQSELGDYDPYKHTTGYVSEYRFVPDQKEELEDAIEQIHKTLMGQVPAEAEVNYLGVAKSLEMYGVDLHPVYGENKSEYFLGLTPIGVVVYKNKKQVGKYFWPRITKVHFKETQFELRVLGKDCNETSFFFEARNKVTCKHLWKCCVEHHTFFRMPENESNSLSRKVSKFGSIGYKHRYSGKTSLRMTRDPSVQLPRPDQSIERSRSKTYPKRTQQTGSKNMSQITTNGENEGTTKIIAPSPVKSFKKMKNENSPETRSKTSAPWEENGPQSGLYNSASDRNKSPKFPYSCRRNPSGGSENESGQPVRRRSRSRCNTSSGSESENSNREHRKKRNRLRQENDMVDSAPQWEAVLRRQKGKTQADPNYRRSRHRSRSRSPDVQAKEELWKHIQKELVDPSGLSEEQLKEIPYTKVETQGDPIRIRHSHSPRSYRQYRRSQCSDGERSILSEVNVKTDLVPPLPVTRSSDGKGPNIQLTQQRENGSKDSLIEEPSLLSTNNVDGKPVTKIVKTVPVSCFKVET